MSKKTQNQKSPAIELQQFKAPTTVANVAATAQKTAKEEKCAAEEPAENQKLTPKEQEDLSCYKKAIKESLESETANFVESVKAASHIQSGKLYRQNHASLEGFFKSEFGIGRSHAYRMANAGEIISRVSPSGDTWKLLTSESHFRPLVKLAAEEQDAVIQLVDDWKTLAKQQQVAPKLVEAAVSFVRPPQEGKTPKPNPLVVKFREAVTGAKGKLPKGTNKAVKQVFAELEKKAAALGGSKRTSGIDWTKETWNPLQGCTRASAGCDNCYAAKLVATRMADAFPGLAEKKETADGVIKYNFLGKILLLPDQLGIPLQNLLPTEYFVNSMSDLFHKGVPDAFIEAVFGVMEKAHWHKFQVLTKRPERMAEFTLKRYAEKAPPANVWLGTSAEDQENFDERYPHLVKAKAAVRWLSCEPLIGPIKFGSLEDIDWVVVGGESGSTRKMDKAWATSIRDQCEKEGVTFFFKQWGDYNEEGDKAKKAKKDGLTPPTLDGVVHNDYPKPTTAPRGKRDKPAND